MNRRIGYYIASILVATSCTLFAFDAVSSTPYALVFGKNTFLYTNKAYAEVSAPFAVMNTDANAFTVNAMNNATGWGVGASAGIPVNKKAILGFNATYFMGKYDFSQLSLAALAGARITDVMGAFITGDVVSSTLVANDFYQEVTFRDAEWSLGAGFVYMGENGLIVGLRLDGLPMLVHNRAFPLVSGGLTLTRGALTWGVHAQSFIAHDGSYSGLFGTSGGYVVEDAFLVYGSLGMVNAFRTITAGVGVKFTFLSYYVNIAAKVTTAFGLEGYDVALTFGF